MKIIVTASEIIDAGGWERFCAARGINEWAVNEGLMESSEEFTLTEDEARRFGLLLYPDQS